MEIYLVRHGIAEDFAENDAARRLTAEGIAKTTRVAKGFAKRVPDVDLIIHSPYKRAKETAKIFAEFYPAAMLKEGKGLTPLDKARSALPLLSEAHGKRVMLVGHEPHMSSLASLLITGSERPVLEFRKAGIAGIACPGGDLLGCYLMFLLSPKFTA